MDYLIKIAVTSGDINGIGPEIIRKALLSGELPINVDITVFGPGEALETEFKGLKVNIRDCGPDELRREYGIVSKIAGEASFRAVKAAAERTIAGEYDALVTAPISKQAVNSAGHYYAGHTEMMKEWCGAEDVIMMFLSDAMIIGLMTTHIALREVADALSIDLALRKIRLLHRELIEKFNIDSPKITLCGLNPHAGEGGMFGREEIEVLIPAAKTARSEGIQITDPLPADTLFKKAGDYSAIMAIYHDQGLIPAKLAAGGAVNYTGGLPIIRTSPDHGTAFDIAGKGIADPSGMIKAINWAVKLCR
ncbi:MAG: 4-hydroxythreonine-4-phosphate dehydrogenase PdxA [candidate division Zixibacteria bacterium]|nr:4-hydroxythreonine-4-phosphate dehydrogenase PdxA [Candidatus Tariuqbacter arcticus]